MPEGADAEEGLVFGPEDSADCPTSNEDKNNYRRPKPGAGNLGSGVLLTTRVYGKIKEFHDGAGLCPPGR